MMPNMRRGEVALRLGSRQFVLRPTFAALARIEHRLDMGILTLAARLGDGNLTLEQTATLLEETLTEPAEIRSLLARGGLTKGLIACCELLESALGIPHE